MSILQSLRIDIEPCCCGILLFTTVVVYTLQLFVLYLLQLELETADDDDSGIGNWNFLHIMTFSMSLPRNVFTLLLIYCSRILVLHKFGNATNLFPPHGIHTYHRSMI